MQNIPTKTDDVSVLPADEFNQMATEMENIITNTGQALTSSDLSQISKAISIYAAGGDFYTDSGTADAYVLNLIGSKQSPTAYFVGMRARFVVGAANTGASTANVNSLGVKNIKKPDGSSDPAAGDLPMGQMVDLTYDGTNLRITAGLPDPVVASGIPVGTMLDYAGAATPSGYLFCYGQAVNRTTYSDLFSIIGTAFGSGDGSLTFNLPDIRGRVKVGLDNLGGSSANRITNANADSLNNTGFGSQTGTGSISISAVTLSVANLPPHSHVQTAPNSSGGSNIFPQKDTGADNSGSNSTGSSTSSIGSGSSFTPTGSFTGTTGANAQPSIAVSVIIKT